MASNLFRQRRFPSQPHKLRAREKRADHAQPPANPTNTETSNLARGSGVHDDFCRGSEHSCRRTGVVALAGNPHQLRPYRLLALSGTRRPAAPSGREALRSRFREGRRRTGMIRVSTSAENTVSIVSATSIGLKAIKPALLGAEDKPQSRRHAFVAQPGSCAQPAIAADP